MMYMMSHPLALTRADIISRGNRFSVLVGTEFTLSVHSKYGKPGLELLACD